MPTMGRQQWAREAVEMFQAQTYPAKELVVVDDAMDPSFAVPPGGTLYRRGPRETIGAKRNIACGMATGPIIMHWDSDDRYSADRMEHQVRLLIESGTDMVGYHVVPWFESDGQMRTGEYRGLSAWPLGVSFCYWRDSWERSPFPPWQTDEDNKFRDRRSFKSFDSEGRISMRIHRDNTSDKRTPLERDRSTWRIAA